MQRDDFIAANRAAWDEVAPVHGATQMDRLRAAFARPGYSCLDDTATRALREIGVQGKAVAQLCCNNARELLSIMNMGASRGVGFDISEPFLAQGRDLAGIAHLPAELIAGDVLTVPPFHDGAFDLVVTTVGVLGWMPELRPFFEVVRRLLRPGGTYFAYEMHPLCDVFEPGDAEKGRLRHSYFRTEPFVERDGLDYYGGTKYDAPPSYWFHHKLSDVLNALTASGLRLVRVDELQKSISGVHDDLDGVVHLPLAYTMVAEAG